MHCITDGTVASKIPRKGVIVQARLSHVISTCALAGMNGHSNQPSNMQAVSTGAGTGLFKKLGRVLREKAAGDLERVFKGTSKTRERLGVRNLPPWSVLCHFYDSN